MNFLKFLSIFLKQTENLTNILLQDSRLRHSVFPRYCRSFLENIRNSLKFFENFIEIIQKFLEIYKHFWNFSSKWDRTKNFLEIPPNVFFNFYENARNSENLSKYFWVKISPNWLTLFLITTKMFRCPFKVSLKNCSKMSPNFCQNV